MMTTINKYTDGEFPTLYCNKLVVTPPTTNLKWSTEKRHHCVLILGSIDIAKTRSINGHRGIIANKGFIVGQDKKYWYFDLYENAPIYVGLAPITQNFSTIEGTAVSQLIDAKDGDKIKFSLTPDSVFTIRHENGNSILQSSTAYKLNQFNRTTLYPWVSTVDTNNMALKIMEDIKFRIKVDTQGAVYMNGLRNEIKDFSLADIIANNGTSIGTGGGNSITNNGHSVDVENNGNVNINGGLSYKRTNITDSVDIIYLTPDQCVVIVSNATCTNVRLPPAGNNHCKYYHILRNYTWQESENWRTAVLRVTPTGEDNIDDMSYCRIPPDAGVKLLSDGINRWRIV